MVGALLKRVYDNTVYDGLNSRDDLMGMMPKVYDGDGQEFYTVHRTAGVTTAMRFQAETTSLPTAQNQSWQNSVLTPKEWWGVMALSMRLIMSSKTNPGAFMEGFKSEVYGFANDAKRFFEIRLVGRGSGQLGVVAAVVSGTPGTVTLTDIADLRKLRVGEVIQIWDDINRAGASAPLDWDGAALFTTIVSIDPATVSFTVADTTGGVTPDPVAVGLPVIDNGVRTATVTFEPMGLLGAISDRDPPMDDVTGGGLGLQNIAATSDADGAAQTGVQVWTSPALRNGGALRPITEKLLQQGMDAVDIVGNGQVDTFITGYGTRLEYAIGQLNIRRNMNTPRISGSTSGGFVASENNGGDYVEHAQIRIIPNRFWPSNVVIGSTWEAHCMKFWARPQWWEDGDGALRRAPDETTNYWAEQFALFNYLMKERNSHVRIEDVSSEELAVAGG